MPGVTFEASDRRQGAAEALDHLIGGQVAEVVGRQRAEQPHPDVGRAGAQRYVFAVRDLVVVGRQPGGLFVDEAGEVTPGAPRQGSQEALVAFGHALQPRTKSRAAGEKPAQAGGDEPQRQPGRRGGKRRRAPEP